MAKVLLTAQSFEAGNGGISAVARMTAAVLSEHHKVWGLACQDAADGKIGSVCVRGFRNRRIPFVWSNFLECRKASHVVYDFAGTARAHLNSLVGRRPYAVWIHGWEVWQPNRNYLQAIAGASLVLANSAYTLDRAGKLFAPGADVRVCALATPEDAPPAAVGPSDGPPTVMLLGRADELFAKGHDILIDIWPRVVAAVPGARLLLVGGGSALGRVRALAAASLARDAIEIAGFVPDECLDSYWRRATVFCMPGFAEGFGLVYADAMRHGLPVIASTDDGGHAINVDAVTGFNVPRANRARLAEVLIALLRDRDLAHTLGAAGHLRWQQDFRLSAFRQRLAAATEQFLMS